MKTLTASLVFFVLFAFSNAQYYDPPEQVQSSSTSSGNEVEISDPSRVRIVDEEPQTTDPGDRVIRFGDDPSQQEQVNDQERLRQEKALLERDRKYFRSVLGNQGMSGDHKWAKKKLAENAEQFATLNKKINDLAFEMRHGLNKHAGQIGVLNKQVLDGEIWQSDSAKKFGESLIQEVLRDLRQQEQSEQNAQEIANNISWIWWWIGTVIIIVLLIVWSVRRKRHRP